MRESEDRPLLQDAGLLVLRLTFGALMFLNHGLGKFQRLTSGEEIRFLDPFGLGAEVSLTMAMTAEVIFSLMVAVGVFTRLSTVPLIITMIVAAFVAHGDDPFKDKEMALLYMGAFTALLLTGPGRFSLTRGVARRFGGSSRLLAFWLK